jgi:hypothetical protein
MLNKREDKLRNLLSGNLKDTDNSPVQEVSFRKSISPVAKIKVV